MTEKTDKAGEPLQASDVAFHVALDSAFVSLENLFSQYKEARYPDGFPDDFVVSVMPEMIQRLAGIFGAETFMLDPDDPQIDIEELINE
ncbi:hypothetical protein [Ferrimonas balearica]|uniref:hypothetical protein n=1 Tax=Ferrimonas balearica TaxID=44012 RepID=UPI001F3AC727|nr:hypothetical protein [Ferrimonas balearica]MBY6093802.1 hypothetical protein [Ferrimonas balearica]